MTQSAAQSTASWSTTIDADVPVSLSVTTQTAVVGGAGGSVSFIDLEARTLSHRIDAGDGLLTVTLSPTGTHLVTTSMSGYALWARGEESPILQTTQGWSSRAVWASPEVVAVSSGRRAVVLNAEGEQLWETEPAASTVTDVAWLREGRRLAVAAYGEVRAHERHQTRPVMVYPHMGSHLALAISPTGKWICSGNQDASIHIWRPRDASELTMSGYPDKVTNLTFDETGRWLAADGAPDITVWDFSGKGPQGTVPRSLCTHDRITAVAWRPGPHAQLASGGNDGTIALWDAASGNPGSQISPQRTITMDAEIIAIAWAGPHRLITTDRSGRIDLIEFPDRDRL